MKKLTMVMRCGDVKAPAESMYYTLIGDDYGFVRMTGSEIVNALLAKKVEITNLGIENKGLVSTNGAIKNYTLVDQAGNLANEPRAVILNRVENEKGLLGYTVFGLNGTLQEMNVAQAVELAKASKIANGKIRHTQKGDIVSSINGEYPLRVLKMEAVTDKSITVSLLFIGSAIDGSGKGVHYAGMIVDGKNAAAISKMYNTLAKSNKEIVDTVTKMSKDNNIANTLGMKVTGNAGFYGIYSIDTIYSLISKANNTVSLPMGKLSIACIDYSDPEHLESNLTVSADLKPLGSQEGTAKGNAALKAYAKTVLSKLQAITIK